MTLVSDHMDTPNPSTPPVPAEKVWAMMTSIQIAMLVTRTADGIQGRPMTTLPKPDAGLIYILTETDSSAARDIRVDGSVFLSYQGGGDHVALSGTARVDADPSLIAGLWNPGAELFWPNGPDGHEVVALVIDPDHADVWDGPGLLRGIVDIVKGAVRRQPPDLGERGSVDL